jgi:hypothetical protein
MRWIRLAPIVLLVAVLPAEAQKQEAHSVLMPDTLKWVEPAVLPGAWLAVLQGDPGKEGLFVYRFKFPQTSRSPRTFTRVVRT